jgi:hypothetical protein
VCDLILESLSHIRFYICANNDENFLVMFLSIVSGSWSVAVDKGRRSTVTTWTVPDSSPMGIGPSGPYHGSSISITLSNSNIQLILIIIIISETSTAGYTPPAKFSPSPNRPSPGRRSTLWRPTNAASPGTRSSFDDLSPPTAVSPHRNVPCSLPLEVCNSSGYVVLIIKTYTSVLTSQTACGLEAMITTNIILCKLWAS